MPARINLENISIVLLGTRIPENIGAAARAIRNMGIGQLVVVDPQNCDLTKICRMATHAASDVVEQMEVCDTLDEALAGFNFVVGTTARARTAGRTYTEARPMASELVRRTRDGLVAIVFGREDRGLTNEELKVCNLQLNIPTDEDYSSLNLAMAVQIVCYEIFLAGSDDRHH